MGGGRRNGRGTSWRGWRGLAASGAWRRAWARRVGAAPWALLGRLARTAAGCRGLRARPQGGVVGRVGSAWLGGLARGSRGAGRWRPDGRAAGAPGGAR
jgi:hypothetical protein